MNPIGNFLVKTMFILAIENQRALTAGLLEVSLIIFQQEHFLGYTKILMRMLI